VPEHQPSAALSASNSSLDTEGSVVMVVVGAAAEAAEVAAKLLHGADRTVDAYHVGSGTSVNPNSCRDGLSETSGESVRMTGRAAAEAEVEGEVEAEAEAAEREGVEEAEAEAEEEEEVDAVAEAADTTEAEAEAEEWAESREEEVVERVPLTALRDTLLLSADTTNCIAEGEAEAAGVAAEAGGRREWMGGTGYRSNASICLQW
jgi:hypothetical protein